MTKFLRSVSWLTFIEAPAVTLPPETSNHRTEGAARSPLLCLSPGQLLGSIKQETCGFVQGRGSQGLAACTLQREDPH